MSDIKLGPVGQEITLPRPRYRSGPSWPVVVRASLEEAEMLDGSIKVNFKANEPRRWAFEWDVLTKAELDDFIWLSGFQTSLHFQSTWEDETWYTVAITNYEHEPLIDVHTDAVRYRVRIALKKVG